MSSNQQEKIQHLCCLWILKCYLLLLITTRYCYTTKNTTIRHCTQFLFLIFHYFTFEFSQYLRHEEGLVTWLTVLKEWCWDSLCLQQSVISFLLILQSTVWHGSLYFYPISCLSASCPLLLSPAVNAFSTLVLISPCFPPPSLSKGVGNVHVKRAGAVPPLSLSLSPSLLASAVEESRRLSVYVSGCSVVGLSHVKIPQEIRAGTHSSPDSRHGSPWREQQTGKTNTTVMRKGWMLSHGKPAYCLFFLPFSFSFLVRLQQAHSSLPHSSIPSLLPSLRCSSLSRSRSFSLARSQCRNVDKGWAYAHCFARFQRLTLRQWVAHQALLRTDLHC